ncbi:MAG: NAD(P)-dependent oxidoreductase [Bacteroidales bacterium]|nr:NAD(P)-dependent oxidoreductase [Bacteroidales bacterium]
MTILITGASGFIGSFIVEEALKRGYEVWAGIRQSSSTRYLQDERIHLAELDLSSSDTLCRQLRAIQPQLKDGRWDYVVHAAGATKCRRKEDFYKTNTQGTENLVWALKSTGMTPQRFVFVSSLSVFGAIREEKVNEAKSQRIGKSENRRTEKPKNRKTEKPQNQRDEKALIYAPILDTDTPRPNTAYGDSKLKAETFLRHMHEMHGFPVVTLRPTGVYGPRERDYFLMAKSIKQHTDFAVGFKPQEITFIYVRDLVAAIFLAIKAEGVEGKAYFLSDGEVYHSRRFSDLLQQEMGNPWVLHIKAPLWLLKAICAVSGTVSGWMGKTTTLNLDKYHILSQRNWQCDITPARKELGYEPQWNLERGVAEAVAWYKQNKWL